VEGVVVAAKLHESAYGVTTKIMVKLDDGRRCWGTCPTTLDEFEIDSLRGRRVAFTAAFERKDDDHSFAFFKRPTKSRRIS